MVRILYSILLIPCLFGELEASPKRRREDQVDQSAQAVGDPLYPIRDRVPNRGSIPKRRVAAEASHPDSAKAITAEDSHSMIAEEDSIPAHGPFRMETLSIIRHLISFFSDAANPIMYPSVNVFLSTDAHIRVNFPARRMSEIEVSTVVSKLLSYILIPDEVAALIGHSVTIDQLTAIATKWGKPVAFVEGCMAVWTEFQSQGYEPHPSRTGFQIFTRPTVLSILKSRLRVLEGDDKQITPLGVESVVPTVMRYSMNYPNSSSSDLLNLITNERPMLGVTLTDIEQIRSRLILFEAALTEEHAAVQLLIGFTQQQLK